MYDKYVIRTYPENCIQENSESDSENELSNLPFKKATYVDDNVYTDDNISPSLLNKETNNTSYYPSNSKNGNISLQERNLKKTSLQKTANINYDSDMVNKQNRININYLNLNSNNKKNIYYNKIKPEEESKENTFEQYYSNDRVDLNKYYNIKQTELHLPSRTLKRYKAQYLDVEKSDNFKVLSYRPEDYDTDINRPKKNSKIIHIFKKQEASELFFPSKRALSPPSPPTSSKNSSKKLQKKIDNNNKYQSFYQTPTLKFQSFFGSFIQQKKPKNLVQAKSTSKSRVNQLNDFNIDKLIEIGDNKSKKLGNILSFGKKIKSLKNRNKIRKRLIEKNNMKYKARTEINTNDENPTPIQRIELNSKDYNLMRKTNINKVYHGQIKRKRNININQSLGTLANKNEQNNNINININNNNNSKSYKQNQSLNKTNIVVKNRRVNTCNETNEKNIVKKKITKSNPKFQGSNFFYQSQNNQVNTTPINSTRRSTNRNNNNMLNKISPIKSAQHQKINIDINNSNKSNNNNQVVINNNNKIQNNNSKFHYSIRNFNNTENKSSQNNYKNYSLNNQDNKIKKELSNKNMLTEIKELEYNESNDNDLIEENKASINIRKGAITDEEKIKKTQRNNNTGLKDVKKSYQKEFKNKRYYGYDDRHNLEGPINNHTTYVSKYTKKADKIN